MMLDLHMARLAKANEVGQIVSLSGAFVEPEWPLVVDGDRLPHHTAALLADTTIALYGGGACLEPAFAPIGGDPAHIVGRQRAGLFLPLERTVAVLAAKAQAGLRLVLSRKPRLQFKIGATLRAVVAFAFNRAECNRLLAREGVGGAEALSPLVAHLVAVGHCAICHVPSAAALEATEPSLTRPIGFDLEGRGADFTDHFNHAPFVARTTGVAKSSPDFSLLPPPDPTFTEAVLDERLAMRRAARESGQTYVSGHVRRAR